MWGPEYLGMGRELLSSFSFSAALCSLRSWRADQQTSEITAWQFLSGRVFRIYPGVISTLIIFTILYFVFGSSVYSPEQFSPVSLFLNALLIRPNIDPVMWSLQLEMIGSVMILGLYYASLRLRQARNLPSILYSAGAFIHGGLESPYRPPKQFRADLCIRFRDGRIYLRKADSL